MKKVLIITFKEFKGDRRATRQARLLKKSYEVYTAGLEESSFHSLRFFKIFPRYKTMSFFEKLLTGALIALRQYKLSYSRLFECDNAVNELRKTKFDLIIVHNLKPLSIVGRIDSSPNILLDTHEFSFDETNSIIEKIFINKPDLALLKKYSGDIKHYITVSDGIAQKYKERVGRDVQVVTNASEYCQLPPRPVDTRKIRIIHHGFVTPLRKIELMIQTMDYVDERFEFTLIPVLLGSKNRYYRKLENMAKERRNVNIVCPRERNEVIRFLNKYDIGLYVLPDTVLNFRLALPNKFFEFIQARLCVAIGPSEEMAKIVRKYDLGVVANDFEPKSMADVLNNLTKEKIEFHKNQSHKNAYNLSEEVQMRKLKAYIENII